MANNLVEFIKAAGKDTDLQEKIQSARFRFTEKMFRTTGDGTRQTSAFPVLQQYYSD